MIKSKMIKKILRGALDDYNAYYLYEKYNYVPDEFALMIIRNKIVDDIITNNIPPDVLKNIEKMIKKRMSKNYRPTKIK